MKFVRTGECHEMKSYLMQNAIYIYIYIYTSMDNAIEALLIGENNEKPSHSLTISLKSRGISLFGEVTGWNSMCLLKGELATTKLYEQGKNKNKGRRKRRRKEGEIKRKRNREHKIKIGCMDKILK